MKETIDIKRLKENPDNPRNISDEKFQELVKSIKDFPQMLELRPIVIKPDMTVLGGNMRLRACKEAGLKKVPIIRAEKLTEAQQREFIIKDNVGFGDWDWGKIINDWPEAPEWGLDVLEFKTQKFDEPEDMILREKTMNHILLSFPIEKTKEIEDIINPLTLLEYCEIKKSSN